MLSACLPVFFILVHNLPRPSHDLHLSRSLPPPLFPHTRVTCLVALIAILHPAQVTMLSYGSLVMDVTETELVGQFVDDRGRLQDEFTIRKAPGYLRPDTRC